MLLSLKSTAFRHAVFVIVLATTQATGCATERSISEATTAVAHSETLIANPAEAVRYGRYTLVELAPERAQHDPMEQIVDVTIPATVTANVGEALRFVLLRSGYRLCEGSGETRELDALPLPAVHLHLGPLTLRETLKVLIGAARDLDVNEAAREVCIRRMDLTGSASTKIGSTSQQPSSSM